MSITHHSIDAMLQATDIVEVISSYIDLKKSGSNFVACCPFHNEKTPSFAVSQPKGLYHCFGCGVGGNVIRFVMEYEKLNFVEAVEKIAAMTNFTLEYEQNFIKKPDSMLLDEVTRFFQKNLFHHQPSLDYLASREVANASIEKFRLGYCGASFELLKFLNSKHLSRQEAFDLGVIGRDNDREYARMSERIIFPIHAPNGKVVGFGGRTMNNANAKYLNSPQTQLFNKSRLLYGYYIAKDCIYKQKKIIICEGYLDVIMLHQAGFECAVATLGTALTREHIPLLRKGEPKVILSYDGDKAGINAAFKASQILAQSGIDGGVVIFKDNLDPADMVAQKRVDELQNLFSNPMPFVEFVFHHIASNYHLSNPIQKESALKEAIAFLHTLSPLLQEEHKSTLAQILTVPRKLISTGAIHSTNLQFKDENSAESVLIKTFLEHKDFIDFAIEYIDTSIFTRYGNEFRLLCQKNNDEKIDDEPSLRSISINGNIKPLSDKAQLAEQLRMVITKAFEKDIEKIRDSQKIESARKSAMIKILKQKIFQLKKGELLPYVSPSTL